MCRVSGAGAVQASKQTNKQTRKQTRKYTVMSKQKRIMAKEKVVDVKREAKSERKGFGRRSDHNVQVPDMLDLQNLQTVDNLQKRKKNIGLEKVDSTVVFGCRQTVIRNLPQLQKLDNVPVSSEEMVSSSLKLMQKLR